ncbi:hypothetical protein GCM10010178_49980 [Lentzea flava]|uniref:Uncharacterized protein n=1 Tax=Lentzea flava TaxID=103732 RepID=A0ABQ2UT24_9PSEU|nr:hypothetical protein GCM10010178_49980 [Lentzea flava]
MNKALRRFVCAVFGVFAVAAAVAMTHADATSTEVRTASKHWVDEISGDDQLD